MGMTRSRRHWSCFPAQMLVAKVLLQVEIFSSVGRGVSPPSSESLILSQKFSPPIWQVAENEALRLISMLFRAGAKERAPGCLGMLSRWGETGLSLKVRTGYTMATKADVEGWPRVPLTQVI